MVIPDFWSEVYGLFGALIKSEHVPISRSNRRQLTGMPGDVVIAALPRPGGTSRRRSRPTGTHWRSDGRRPHSLHEVEMYAVIGITGKVGGTVAQRLLAAGGK